MGFSSNGPPPKVATFACQSWYDEIKDYDFKNGGFSMDTGHFTQLVWKSSKKLGIGKYEKGSSWVVVGLYDPQGNVRGKYDDNVKPKGPPMARSDTDDDDDDLDNPNEGAGTDYQETGLQFHNRKRRDHDAPPMELDPEVSNVNRSFHL